MSDNKDFFELKQGDKLEMEFKFQYETGIEAIAGAWLVSSSQDCVVNFHQITDERLKLVRNSSLEWHEKYMSKEAEKNGGVLTTGQIENYFKKQRFVSRLHDGKN
jgi:hypothetical protein